MRRSSSSGRRVAPDGAQAAVFGEDGRLRAQERALPGDGRDARRRQRDARIAAAVAVFSLVVRRHRCRAARPTRRRQGGGVVGFLLGGLFVALGVGRLTMLGEKTPEWRVSCPASSASSTRRRSSRSRTARSRRRSTSRSGSSRCTRSASRPLVLLRGRALRRRLALVRGGHDGDPGDGRRRDVRPPRVQRPRRLRDRLGALPRLPDRDRALGALPAPLPRRRVLGAVAPRRPLGRRRGCVRDRCHRGSSGSSGVRSSAWDRWLSRSSTFSSQVLLVVLGFASSSRPSVLDATGSASAGPTWATWRFALPLAMLAYTGLETVANLAQETREPGRDAPAQPLLGDRSRRRRHRRDRVVGLSAFPAQGGRQRSATSGCARRSSGSSPRSTARCRPLLVDVLRVYVGLTGALILLAAATTSISGFTRLAYSLGEHGQLPRAFGRLNRRTLVSREAIVAAAGLAIALVVLTDGRCRRRRRVPREPLLASACWSRSRSRSSR